MNAIETKSNAGLYGRRCLRYSLRGLLGLVVVVALPVWWLRLELDKLAAEHDMIAHLREAGADVHTTPAEPRWFWYRVPEILAPHQNRARAVRAWRAQTPLAPRHMSAIARLRDLRELQIVASTISDEDLRVCEGLGNLEMLDLTLCARITHLGLSHCLKACGLKHLLLHGTAFTDEGVGTVATFEQLESLMLTSTSVTDDAMPRILSLDRLNWLGLPRGVTSAGVRRIDELTELSHLHIWLNRGDDVEALTSVRRLPKLTDLTILGDGLTNAGLEIIARAPALEDISIRGAHSVDSAGLRTLKKLPKLKYLGLTASPYEPQLGEAEEPYDAFATWERLGRFEAKMAPIKVDIAPAGAGEHGVNLWNRFDVETGANGD